VVARELGIPAVFGVPHATELLAAGQRVVVDGARGSVRIVEDRAARVAAPTASHPSQKNLPLDRADANH
jgi:phosphoenolpyruvate-protein kinase (PTS system EI component)